MKNARSFLCLRRSAAPLRSAWPLLWSALAGPVLAQSAPDSGAVRQQIERAQSGPVLAPPLPAPLTPLTQAAPAPEAAAASGPTVTVSRFRLQGHTLLGEAALQALLVPYLARPISLAELEQAAADLVSAYRRAGWLATAVVPPQDATDGLVLLRIVEARFAGVALEGAPSQRIAPAVLLSYFEARQGLGQPVNVDALDRGLLLADSLPGINVVGVFEPGEQDGQTRLLLKSSDGPRLLGDLGVDNNGSRATGAQRLLANLNVNGPLQRGDQFSAQLLHTEGSDYLRAGYSLPLGIDGWRLGATASDLRYRVIAPAELDSRGSSASVGADLTHPLLRSRQRNLNLQLQWERRNFVNQASGALVSNYRIDGYTLGLNGSALDAWAGGGANTASLQWSQSQLRNHSASGANPASEGQPERVRLSLARQQNIGSALSALASFSGQYASAELNSADRFYLGGSNGVRAYPASEGGGSTGELLNLELRWRLHAQWQLIGFVDAGRVREPAQPWGPAYRGKGLALAWTLPEGASLRATWARRIGRNPSPQPDSGRDRDGTLELNRLWLNALWAF